MATFNKVNAFVKNLAEKQHNLASDTLKWFLTNSDPTATATNISGLTEITPGNGYIAGGFTVTQFSSSQTSGTYKLVLNDTTVTASGGPIGPFRYAVLQNSTAFGLVIGYYDYGVSLTLTNGNSFTVDADGTLGTVTIA